MVIDNSSSQDIPIIYPARSIAFSEDSVQTPVQAGLVTINYNLSIKFALNWDYMIWLKFIMPIAYFRIIFYLFMKVYQFLLMWNIEF